MKRINTGSIYEQSVAYSRAIDDGNYLFVSGITGIDYNTGKLAVSITDQITQCFVNLERTCELSGYLMGNLVRLNYICSDRQGFKECWPVINRYLDDIRPASTVIIAETIDINSLIEIEATIKR